jgi:hypothetical protein
MKKSNLLVFPAILFLLSCCSPLRINAQESKTKKNHEFWHRVSVGGNLGLQFGTVTAVNLSPEAMVRVVDQLHVGVGFSYDYLRAKNYFWDDANGQYIDFQSNVYGGRLFLRYYLRSLFDNFLGNLFAHAEYEYLYYTRPYTIVSYTTPITDPYGNFFKHGTDIVEINSLYVGAGYEQPLSDRVFMDFLILYNLNETYYSPYSNPVIRLGFRVVL